MNCLLSWVGTGIVVAITLVVVPGTHAGPPLICWPFDIGQADSLPWAGTSWDAARADYDLNQLVGDTLALLTPSTPVIVRMETLRRATIYASRDARVAKDLLNQLKARAAEAEARRRPEALAWFDAGYLAECYKQMPKHGALRGVATIDGYTWVSKAIRWRGGDAEMEFAAALISSSDAQGRRREADFERALAGAADGSLLARNLVTHCHLLGKRATSLAELRAQVGSARY